MFDLLVSPFFDSQGGQIKVRFGGTLRVRPTMVSLAAKLLRIIYAVLKHGEAFSYEKAGISRSALAALKAAQPAEVGNA